MFLYISAFVRMANQVSGAKEQQMHQKDYLLPFSRLYSVIFEVRLTLKHHNICQVVADLWKRKSKISASFKPRLHSLFLVRGSARVKTMAEQ